MRTTHGTLLVASLMTTLALPDGSVHAASWIAVGPRPILQGQTQHVVPDGEVSGAVQALVPDPVDANVLYAGSVNGGVWKTTNARATHPAWTALTDDFPSLSIGALSIDPTDGTHRTLVAAIGRFSSFQRTGGALTGLLRSTDAGQSWTNVDGGGTLAGKDFTAVASRGTTLLASVDYAEPNNYCNLIGVFRSTDGGRSFTQVAAGLPAGRTTELAEDPSSTTTLYAAVTYADVCAHSTNGVFKSTDTGATWTRISDGAIETLLTNDAQNVKIAVGAKDNVYVGIVRDGDLAGLFRSGDGGRTWLAMDLPTTVEDGTPAGLGAFDDLLFSIVADPVDANLVYVGGTAQPGPFPNSIGAGGYVGRLFRGDASRPSGQQWVHLTSSNVVGPPGGGTASNSAPHADSRRMVFDAAGDLLEADDGGVYRRTSPRTNGGDWSSVNGDLQVAELHSVAYDELSGVVIGGAQDNGVSQQTGSGKMSWRLRAGGDGGDVAVAVDAARGRSVRYFSSQELDGFEREFYDATNAYLGREQPTLTVSNGGAPLKPLFLTPFAVNRFDADRLVIVASNSIYESLDGGYTLVEIGPGQGLDGKLTDAIAYGGRRNGVDAPDVLYVGRDHSVVVRTSASAMPTASAAYPGSGLVRDLAIDPDDWMHAFALEDGHLFETTDAGTGWRETTGNLSDLASRLLSVECVATVARRLLIVGTNAGTYVSSSVDFAVWAPLATGLPNALVYDLTYAPGVDVLTAATFGRGAWQLPRTTATLPAACEVGVAGAKCAIDRLLANLPCGGTGRAAKRYYRATTKKLHRDDRRLATIGKKARRRQRILRAVRKDLAREEGRIAHVAGDGTIPSGCAASIRQGLGAADDALARVD